MQGAGVLGFSTFFRASLHPSQLSIFDLFIPIQAGSTSDKSDRKLRLLLSGINLQVWTATFFFLHIPGQVNQKCLRLVGVVAA